MIIPLKHILEPFRREVAVKDTIITIAFEGKGNRSDTLIDIGYSDTYIPTVPLKSTDPHSLFYDEIIEHFGDIEFDTTTDYISTKAHYTTHVTLVVHIKDVSKLTAETISYLETSGKFFITDHSRNHNVLKRYETRDLDTIRELF